MIKERCVYIGGPMTNIPKFNFPAFDEAAKQLRKEGFEVWSPAEMDDKETRRMAMKSPDGAPGSGSSKGETWGDFLARDVKIVADKVDAVVVIPGWHKSKGARLETFIAFVCNKPIYYYTTRKRVPMRTLVRAWTGPKVRTKNAVKR
jgi:hypothetical protein